jgi:hypothetical protein
VAGPGSDCLSALLGDIPVCAAADYQSGSSGLCRDHCFGFDFSFSADGWNPHGAMTPKEIVECTGKNVYQIWLEVAMREFDAADPRSGFKMGEIFVDALLDENPHFE